MAKQGLRLAIAGDIALGNHPKTPGFGFLARYRSGIPPEAAWRLQPPGPKPDIFVANLEFPLVRGAGRGDCSRACVGDSGYIGLLTEAGITAVNVANNHMWEHGKDEFRETVTSLRESGIKVVGLPDDFQPESIVETSNGTRVAILGWSDRPRQGFSEKPAYNEFELESAKARVMEAVGRADLVVVSLHWGDEFVCIPDAKEVEVAEALVSAGAHVVFGHHPHVMRPIVEYRGGLIAFSLGNFVGDMTWNPTNRESGCLTLEFRDGGIHDVTLHHAFIEGDFLPRYLTSAEAAERGEIQAKRGTDLQETVRNKGYEALARRKLFEHQLLTIRFLVRNIFRYPLRNLMNIAGHAISSRLTRKGN